MRMLVTVEMPHEPFNTLVRNGKAGEILARILESTKPDVIFFTEQDGHRGAVMSLNINDSSEIPALAEPWFLNFNADCRFRIAMTPEELGNSGLDAIAKKWA